MDTPTRNSLVTLPGAIIIAGAIIAIAIIWTKRMPPTPVQPTTATDTQKQVNLAPVTAADHILGNPNAPIKIVEFSDPSCPFCKSFNPILVKVMADYGAGGKVAWVYRHYPLDKADSDGNILHPNAGNEAQALECAASLGGNDTFWAYEKKLYEITPAVTQATPQGLDQKQLPIIAKSVGLDPVAFNECLTSGQFKDKVEKQYLDGVNAGVSGTPTSIIITPSGTKIPLEGMVSYNTLKTTIDTLLTSVK